MASATDYRRNGVAFLAVGSTAVLVWFGNGLNPWWPLLWFAPLPVLLFTSRRRSSHCISLLASRQSQYVALLPRAACAAFGVGEHLLHRGAGVHGGSVAVPRVAAAERLVERAAGVPGDMGLVRIPAQPQFAPRYGGQLLLFTAEFLAVAAACLRYWTLGHKLSGVAISCRHRHWPASTSYGADAGVAHCWCGAGPDWRWR